MKKLISLLVVLVVAVGFVGCGDAKYSLVEHEFDINNAGITTYTITNLSNVSHEYTAVIKCRSLSNVKWVYEQRLEKLGPGQSMEFTVSTKDLLGSFPKELPENTVAFIAETDTTIKSNKTNR